MRNPPWSRDELIVTLDFYLAHTPSLPGKSSPEIVELSQFLNAMQTRWQATVPDKFRNQNGVYMKLMNFRHIDPEYPATGLNRGSNQDSVVWERYASNPDELRKVSEAIRSFVASDLALSPVESVLPDEQEAEEGKVLTRLHAVRERDPSIIRRKKQQVLQHQKHLACEGCNFDFEKFYGDRGRGFIECHHTKPLSELSPQGGKTKMSDLSLLCSNCHRMVHKSRPWLSIGEIQSLVRHPQGLSPNGGL